ncbi:MAG: Lipin/Ned1/Smp2-domain-containing protein, partial [Piptocephalis tieghemiana]
MNGEGEEEEEEGEEEGREGERVVDDDDDEGVKEHDIPPGQKRSHTYPLGIKNVEGIPRKKKSARGGQKGETHRSRRWQYAKTLRLTSDQLKSLGLRRGANEVRFTVAASEGRVYCTSKIFLWPEDAKVVISDIDGTITKSDALGHIFNMVGKDWTHPGVAKLYTDIARNGYHFLYLTSRAIGQADATRGYLRSVEQGPFQLPDGPVIMSPDRLFTSLHREVIMRKPEVFKMACLRDIRRLFTEAVGDVPGAMETPFYAGFGNRITDAMSYRSVNVPTSRIFTIEYNGDVRLELATGFRSSYISLTDLVDQIFPSLQGGGAELMVSEYNDWNYWRPPLPSLDIDALLAEDRNE